MNTYTKPVMTEDRTVSSNAIYIGNRTQVCKILKAMKSKQNSILVNGMIVIKINRNKFEFGEWMSDFHTGTLEEVVNSIS